MQTKTFLLGAVAFLAAPSTAHMEMKYPAPVLSSFNEFNGGQTIDTYTAPMSGRSQFPCRDPKVLQALGTKAGSPVDTWAAGSSQEVTITGGAFHGGGSCQLSLSYDQGTTFKVIKSFIGNCPSANGDTSYSVDIPSDAPSGEAVFAWTWFNKIGNREMYMNCAVVDISGGSAKRQLSERAVAFDDRPNIFVANIDGSEGCRTSEGSDVDFPNPGEEVENTSSSTGLYIDESLCPDPSNTGAGDGGPVADDQGGADDDSSADAPAETPVDAPAETPVDAPAETPVDAPAESPVDIPAETPTETVSSSEAVENPAPTEVPGSVFITTPPSGDNGAATTTEEEAPISTDMTLQDPTTLVTITKPVDVSTPIITDEASVSSSTSGDETSAAPSTSDEEAPVAPSTSGDETSAAPSTSDEEAPVATPTAPEETPVPSAPATSSGAFDAGEACEPEGVWNCIGGSAFQRCASGQWSAIVPMAPGTSCKPGVSANLFRKTKRGGARIGKADF